MIGVALFFFGSSSWKGSTLFFCFWVRSSPLVSQLLHPHLIPLTPAPLQAGFPGLCQHAEWGGVLRPSWTRCPAAPHSSVSGPVEKCPPAADWEQSAARQTVCSPACVCDPSHPVYLCDNVWLRLNFFLPFPPPTLFVWVLVALMLGEPRPLWIWLWSRAPRGAGGAPGVTTPAGQVAVARPANASGHSRSQPMRWRRAAGRGCVLWCELCRFGFPQRRWCLQWFADDLLFSRQGFQMA